MHQARFSLVQLWLFRLAAVLIISYLFWLVSRAVQQNISLGRQIKNLHNQLAAEEQKNEETKAEIAYEQTDVYREKQLRERLGYRKPGEVVISMPDNVDSSVDKTATPVPTSTPPNSSTKPIYRLWLDYFFGQSTS